MRAWQAASSTCADLSEACERCGIIPFDERVNEPEAARSADAAPRDYAGERWLCAATLRAATATWRCGPQRAECMERETMEADARGLCARRLPHARHHRRLARDATPTANGSCARRPQLGRRGHRPHATSRICGRAGVSSTSCRCTPSAGCTLVTSLPYFNERGLPTCSAVAACSTARWVCCASSTSSGTVCDGAALKIDVAYNVAGPFLPPDQRELGGRSTLGSWTASSRASRFDNLLRVQQLRARPLREPSSSARRKLD